MPNEDTDRQRFFELLGRAGEPLSKAKRRKGARRKTGRGYTEIEILKDKKGDILAKRRGTSRRGTA